MAQKLFLSLAVLGIWSCCFSLRFYGDWSINSKYTPSTTSRFYVLNDWQDTFTQEKDIAALPAAKVSDIMLKTMGILKDGASWPGVSMGNLFNRPLATALFLVDGISSESSLEPLSASSFGVDQTGLTGCTCGDTKVMFGGGDNVAQHMSELFEQGSQTSSVSANVMAAQASSANGAYTAPEQLDALVKDIQAGEVPLARYGLQAAATKLEPTSEVDSRFLAELVLIRQTIEQLKELTGYVTDSSPDVFVFTISTLEGVEERYGKGSSKMGVATELVKQVIQESSDALVEVYGGKVLVQALVLEWNHLALDTGASELEAAYNLLLPYLAQQDRDAYFSSLPRVTVKDDYIQDSFLCGDLRELLQKSNFYAHCPKPEFVESKVLREAKSESRLKRDAEVEEEFEDFDASETLSNTTVANIADSRSNIFSAVFLITLFVTVSLGLALYTVSVALWNMDPGRDSIIYRQVADPAIRMQ